METETKTFIARCREFFGYRAGTGMSDFVAELRALTQEDREELVRLFNESGMPTLMQVPSIKKTN